jgi:hypothetical protein
MLAAMPVAFTHDPAGRFAVLSVTDPYTIDDWKAAVMALLRDPVYIRRRAVLVDRRQCEAPTAAFVAQMTAFAQSHAAAVTGMYVAAVVRDDAGFGMGRMTELNNPGMRIRVFRGYPDAEEWLASHAHGD